MVFSTEHRPRRGQEFRDRVRCEALESSYTVYTMDDKHDATQATVDRHCTANFADTHRMLKSMDCTWGPDLSFDMIVLDYFFSPAGWANVRWSESFFKSSLPAFVLNNRLAQNGTLWLPHVRHVDEMLEKHGSVLGDYYEWTLVNEPALNPLYAATDKVTSELLRTPDFMTNESQLKPLLDQPFYALKRKAPPMRPCPQMSPVAKTAIMAKEVKKAIVSHTVGRKRRSTFITRIDKKNAQIVSKRRMITRSRSR